MKPRSCALIFNDFDELLLIHRVKDGREYWVFPGGSIEVGETPIEAIVREVAEETSLSVRDLKLAFEQTNDLRYESYFIVENYSGDAELGVGPEYQRQSPINQYKLVWVSASQFEIGNVQPVTAKKKILKLWQEGKL